MLRRTLLSMGAMLLLCVIGGSQAYGSFIIAVSLNGGAKTTVASGPDFTPLMGASIFGGFKIDFLTATSVNGSLSRLVGNNLNITHLSGPATDVLNIFVSQTNYTLPTGPFLTMQSSAAGAAPNASSVPLLTGIFQAYFDASNTSFGTASSNGLQNANSNGASYDTGSAFGSYANSGLYSVTSQLNVVLGLGNSTDITSSISLTAVPVPGGLVLVATVTPLFCLGWLRRRRLANA